MNQTKTTIMRVIVIIHGFAWSNFRKEHSGGAASSCPHSRALAPLRLPADSLGARDPTGRTGQVRPLSSLQERKERVGEPCFRVISVKARGPRAGRPPSFPGGPGPPGPAPLLWGSMVSCSRAPKGRARGAAAAAAPPNASGPRQASLGLP